MHTPRPTSLAALRSAARRHRTCRPTLGGPPRATAIGLLVLGILFIWPPPAAPSIPGGTAPRSLQQAPQQEELTIHLIVSLARAGASDETLVAIIRDSGKSFTLTAEDILFLRDQGVGEPAIRAMLGAPAGDELPPDRAPAPAPAPPSLPPAEVTAEAPPPAEVSREHTPIPTSPAGGFEAAASLPVEVRALHEESSTEHEHSVVAHGGVGLLFIRAEDGYPTTGARAEEAAHAYEAALRTPGASIELRWTGGEPSLWVRADSNEHLLLRVGRDDAAGYSRHGSESVEPALLAAWWGALLSDYVAVIRDGVAPRLLVDQDLAALAEAIRARSPRGSPVSVETLGAALLTLDPEIRERLEELGHAVPQDFSLPILPDGGNGIPQ